MEYRHEPLKRSGNSIRLLQIQPAAADGTIRCTISQYLIHDRPVSVAISYTWGDASNPKKILINGKDFEVRQNLWDLLWRLQQCQESRHLWIDAICIDQNNLAERSFQVQLMAQIYERADHVIIWLGKASEDSGKAIKFIEEMASYQARNSDMALQWMYFLNSHQEEWQYILNLLQRKYWTRTWIIQEFLLARSIELVCGADRLQWKLVERLVHVILQIFHGLGSLGPGPLQSTTMLTIAYRLTTRRLRVAHQADLKSLMWDSYDSECSEPRDKVYGMLAITDNFKLEQHSVNRQHILPDYAKDVVEVYFELLDYFHSTSPDGMLTVGDAILAQNALKVNMVMIMNYARRHEDPSSVFARMRTFAWETFPDYVGTIHDTLHGWSDPQNLRAKLLDWDWVPYVGKREERFRKPWSLFSKNIVVPGNPPASMVDTAVAAADQATQLNLTHNYTDADSLAEAFSKISLSGDKRQRMSDSCIEVERPTIIFDGRPCLDYEITLNRGDIKLERLGFACTDAQKGDLICQFKGFDTTLIIRMVQGKAILIGRALMVKHRDIYSERNKHPLCKAADWSCLCPEMTNRNNVKLTMNPILLAELFS